MKYVPNGYDHMNNVQEERKPQDVWNEQYIYLIITGLVLALA